MTLQVRARFSAGDPSTDDVVTKFKKEAEERGETNSCIVRINLE